MQRRRSRAHVPDKSLVADTPYRANVDAARAVIRVLSMLRIVTAQDHVFVNTFHLAQTLCFALKLDNAFHEIVSATVTRAMLIRGALAEVSIGVKRLGVTQKSLRVI